ncbi:hypothetical protein INT43_008490 [Umbelopsis isabellina]|uniref:Inosine/uridine-preferring nucleoside hydrolase domain-containing protein n=1 Tax=Mortierella isabellina TaxID=91625 RepID=A0A8H7PW06_MORIS|nr:hypothetical protein INT43_008490 [Umbelopsis isabellina]
MVQPLIIDCDPGIDDVLALILAFKSPEVDVRAVTLTHGNTTLKHVKRNAVTLMDVMAAQHIEDEKNGMKSQKQSTVLAVGRATPLNSDQVFATEFHGHDGLGNIYEQGLHTAPTDWENQLLHDAEKVGEQNKPFQSTSRDAADEILHQLRVADPLSVSILAIGPLTNLALAMQRDVQTFSRAKDIIILGGSLTAGNITPYGEFNFVADPVAADLVMTASKGFVNTEQGAKSRFDLLSQGKSAPMHIVVLPIDSAECGAIPASVYRKQILPLRGSAPLYTFINSFLLHAFKAMEELFKFDYMATYDAFAMILLLDMLNGTLEKNWCWKWHDMRVETAGKYTMGMSCIDTRDWESPDGSWNDQSNVVQVITKASGDNFIQSFMKRIFNVDV